MPATFQDYYKILGVSRSASQDDIKKAFRRLAREHHPDVTRDKSGSDAKFKSINEAYAVLGNPENRKKYDRLGADWDKPEPPPGARYTQSRRGRGGAGGSPNGSARGYSVDGTGFSDFFEQFFAQQTAGAGGYTGGDPREAWRSGGDFSHNIPGADIEADLAVTLDEVLRGSVRSITLRSSDETGSRPPDETMRVRIPAGVRQNQRIRVAGKGHPSPGSGRPGDLYLHVRYTSHPDFRVEEDHLITDLDLYPWELALGITTQVPTLEEPVRIKVAAGTQPDSTLRVRGRGLPHGAAGGRGDLLVKIGIRIPVNLTPEQRLAWEEVSKAHQVGETSA